MKKDSSSITRIEIDMFWGTALFLVGIFMLVTFGGVFGLLPSDIQETLNPHPLSLSLGGTSTANAETVKASLAVGDLPTVEHTPQGDERELPVRIIIPTIGINTTVSNPASASLGALDDALLQGAVHYPGSAYLNENGNVFLFGHSSYLKFVHNPVYRTFDGIQNLKAGDEIKVEGPDSTYIYTVTKVSFLKNSEAGVNLATSDRILTLSTCNSFGDKEDRIMVQASFEKKVDTNLSS